MKRILIPFLLLTGIMGYLSCQKENSSDPAAVKAAKTEGIKKGEPVTFSVENTSGQTAKWSVTPSANVQINSNGDNATILFRHSGSYAVLASLGSITKRITVNVSDSSYCDSTRLDSTGGCPLDTIPRDSIPGDTTCHNCLPHDTTWSLIGDKIRITPLRTDSGAVSGLIIQASTYNTYPCTSNSLLTNVSTSGNNYSFEYTGVFIPWNCNGGQAKSQSARVLFPIQDGSHGFSVRLNNVTYTGSFTKTGHQYNFIWSDTSAVTISPLTIN